MVLIYCIVEFPWFSYKTDRFVSESKNWDLGWRLQHVEAGRVCLAYDIAYLSI